MSNDELLTDEYVAELLKKEAADCSLKYSSIGMEAFHPSKMPSNMLRPNKRFLQHIIRDTDRHNSNLLAKETAESQARLRELEKEEARQRRKKAVPQDVRRRQMGDIMAILGRGNAKIPSSSSRSEGRSVPQCSAEQSRHRRSARSTSPGGERPDRKRRRRRDGEKDTPSDRESRRRDKSRRSRSRSPKERDAKRRHRARSPLERDDRLTGRRSERAKKNGSTEKDKTHLTSAHYRASKERASEPESRNDSSSSSRPRREAAGTSTSDTDPLDDLIGPAPPPHVRVRGRGFQSGASCMDKRFEEDYDPKADVDMEEDNRKGNWDDAVEAFRDRRKWELHQEQRMRAAGFGDEEIARWKKGGERDEKDVRWSKAGEEREWDRGKGGLSGIFSEDN
ncbi:hypothetical protein SODALDRAFT_345339 [Sodiomyces alkalinus F11]|uniref:Pre-mRNA-splicing factor 38B n=1 Tax=Sodiomyces alkalinus (strain CBS 110278 / VKM F-3762 / F11) TaxID=1314773 RepID=A0A3N2PT07_SODAK|nr:hypothetical protein SODALDRAFT_345339 [Sodiomyces alkalinus F11]ROT37655.1 hypothetical protein SODALDRAFT_345339 [Sodiomyces alkalinus F11]